MMEGHNAFQLMDKYKVDHALLKDDMPVTNLLEQSPQWQVMTREKAWQGEYILFVKTAGTPVPAATCAPIPMQH